MTEEYTFTPSDVNMSNIASCSKQLLSSVEGRICELAEIAASSAEFFSELLSSGMSFYDGLVLLSENRISGDPVQINDCLPENRQRIRFFSDLLDAHDRAVFSDLLSEYLSGLGHVPKEEDFFETTVMRESFVYVRNSFSDEAYEVFSQAFEDPRVKYASSFKEALRTVYDDVADFCLLPIEEKCVRILAVEELLFRGDYKINGITPVFGFDGTASMKYALVSKNIIAAPFAEDDDRYLEIRLPTDSSVSISSLIDSATVLGCGLYRVNTVTFNTEDGERSYFSLVFKRLGKDFCNLLIYLNLFVPDFIPVGIYKNIEQ